MKEKFDVKVMSMHLPDRGETENVSSTVLENDAWSTILYVLGSGANRRST